MGETILFKLVYAVISMVLIVGMYLQGTGAFDDVDINYDYYIKQTEKLVIK